jgi:hypothetical protein
MQTMFILTMVMTSLYSTFGFKAEKPVKHPVTGYKADAHRTEAQDPPPLAVVQGCRLRRTSTGQFTLNISGFNFIAGAQVTIGGVRPKKLRFKHLEPGTVNSFTIIIAKGRVCRKLPAVIIVADLGLPPSQPFFCNEVCPF